MERAAEGTGRAHADRWAGVGQASGPELAAAARQAVREAVSDRGDAVLILLFVGATDDLDEVVEAATVAAGAVPVAGCSAQGQLTGAGVADSAVVALALGGGGLEVSLTAVDGEDPRDAGARVGACVGDISHHEHRVLFLFADDEVTDHAEMVRGAYSVVGAGVPLAGGVSGPGGAIFTRAGVRRCGVLGVAVGSDAPIGVGYAHGLTTGAGEPMLVTRAEGGRVLALDERPAADVLRERLGGRLAVEDFHVQPLGMPRRAGEAQVRVAQLDADSDRDGGVRCAVPEGALLWVMDVDAGHALNATDAACAAAVDGLAGAPPQALLAFDCLARRSVLGDEGTRAELELLRRHASGAPIAGLYTLGEFARTHGTAGLHHSTFVAVAVA